MANSVEDYREHLSTLDEAGNRKWIYPKKPKGKYHTWRAIVAVLLLTFLFGAPFIKINGNPLLQFDVIERKFSILGNMFFPQDFHIFMFAMIVGIIFIGVFTLIFGRIFCGWVCPQTIFMEMIFRKIEYFIEGDWTKQKQLNRAPWTASKIFKKTAKHLIFFIISFFISNIFLAYVIGSDDLLKIMSEPPSQHIVGLIAIIIFSFLFYGVFAFMREQVCTNICPYGRLQSVLLDKYSIVVAYDHKRGESRGKFRKNEDRATVNKGDCIDCKQCINVCPTGIDIRNGTQLECVNCTACIDVCDDMMANVGLPGGLIRYASEHNIETGSKFKFTKRLMGFSTLLIVLTVIFIALLTVRGKLEATIMRTPGMLYSEPIEGKYSNLYNYSIANKTSNLLSVQFKLESTGGTVQMIGQQNLNLDREQITEGSFFIHLDKNTVTSSENTVVIGVYAGDEKVQEVSTSFLGPK
ncbi:MAG: cytochrome c oxidase accessory protein CcoG [Aureispira sp.]|nr:cytochrome c oxidase accessory protein CcoG [Aureispira sp.]